MNLGRGEADSRGKRKRRCEVSREEESQKHILFENIRMVYNMLHADWNLIVYITTKINISDNICLAIYHIKFSFCEIIAAFQLKYKCEFK